MGMKSVRLMLVLMLVACGHSESPTTPNVTITIHEPVKSIVIAPVTMKLGVGASVTYTATAFDATAQSLPTAIVTWSVSDDKLATISAQGVFKALAVGTVTITAKANGIVSNTATATIQ